MDKVVLDGVEYVKASAVAKQFHYTSDYIGQLCRAKKVDARLVGRTWFVRPESIAEHKSAAQNNAAQPAKKEASKQTPKEDDSALKVKINRVDVNAPLKNKTAKSAAFHPSSTAKSISSEHSSLTKISYHSDTETLLPELDLGEKIQSSSEDKIQKEHDGGVKKILHIEPAFAKKLKISAHKNKQVSFRTTELPDVALSGKLRVSTYKDCTTDISTALERQSARVEPTHQPDSIEDANVPFNTRHDVPVQQKPKKINFPSPAPPTSLWLRLMPLGATLLAVVTSVLLLMLGSEVTVSNEESTANLSIEIKQFLQLFKQ